MLNEILSGAILFTFAILLLIGAISTLIRVHRYHRMRLARPVLLGRDRDLLLGLAVPFLLIALVRAFSLQWLITDSATGQPHIWWLLITGLLPIYAVARYDYFELFKIERTVLRQEGETALQAEDRQVGDTRRELQAEAEEADKP